MKLPNNLQDILISNLRVFGCCCLDFSQYLLVAKYSLEAVKTTKPHTRPVSSQDLPSTHRGGAAKG